MFDPQDYPSCYAVLAQMQSQSVYADVATYGSMALWFFDRRTSGIPVRMEPLPV
jgi:hypothetical protein